MKSLALVTTHKSRLTPTAIFILLMSISALMLLTRALVIALFVLTSTNVAAVYIIAELCLYLFYKIIRGDFYYWMPGTGCFEICVSIFGRVVVKVVTDFTSNGECCTPLHYMFLNGKSKTTS